MPYGSPFLLFAGNGEILPQAFTWQDTILNILARLEETGLSLLLRESGVAFFSSLTLHSLAMAFVVGVNLLLAVRLIGLLPQIELQLFKPYLTLHWWCTGLIFISGAALLLAYPAKALTNPVFYLKLAALSLGLILLARLQARISAGAIPAGAKGLGMLMIGCWVTTIFAGRFLAYTNSILLASSFY